MAYTIIEVERMINIPSRKIRFWADKGLFPFVERDENGVRYFAKSDIVWVEWVDCLRSCGMSIDDIKHYIKLTRGGIETTKERKELLERHFDLLNKELEILHIALYNEMIKTGIDYLNPNTTAYQWPPDSKGKAK